MINEVLIKRGTKPDLIVNVQVDVDGSGLIEFHEFVKFIVGANEKILLSVPECDIRMDFYMNEYPNIFVSKK